jgi:Tol biopolymer transport system component
VEISTKIRLTESSAFAISPDGLHLVFAGSGDDGVVRLWARSLSSESDARPLPGTEVELGGLVPPMFWSPDSRHVAFDAAGHLKKVDVMGGAPQTICRLPALAVGGSWSRDGVVVVGTPQSGIFSCPASGGPASLVTRVDPSQQHAAHMLPSFLPDGRHFVYLAVSRTAPERTGIYVHALDAPATSSVRLLAAGFGAAYVHDDERDQGHLLFVRDGALLAHAFDAARLRLSGDAVRIAGPVGSFLDGAFFSASATGTLVFTPPAAPRRLAWLDRQGNVMERVGEPGPYSALSLAPGDSRAVIVEHPVRATLEQDLWIVDLPSGRASRITFDGALEDRPIWSEDGTRIVFTVTGGVGSLFEMSAGGGPSPRVLLESSEHKVPDSISPDGESLLFTSASIGPSRLDVWVLPLTGERTPYPLIRRPFDQSDAQLSPDGRWVAYVSNESGRQQVLLRPFDPSSNDDAAGVGESVVVSTSGGMSPRWRKDGSELFFTTPAGAVLGVSVASGSGSTVKIGSPQVLFHAPGMAEDWAVSADGQRFLVLLPETPTPGTSFSLILDWQAALDSVR